MIKVYIGIAVIVFTFGSGWKAKGWLEDSKDVKILTESIKNDNDTKAALTLLRTESAGVSANAKREIYSIQPLVVGSGGCPDFGQLRNEAFASFPEMYLQ